MSNGRSIDWRIALGATAVLALCGHVVAGGGATNELPWGAPSQKIAPPNNADQQLAQLMVKQEPGAVFAQSSPVAQDSSLLVVGALELAVIPPPGTGNGGVSAGAGPTLNGPEKAGTVVVKDGETALGANEAKGVRLQGSFTLSTQQQLVLHAVSTDFAALLMVGTAIPDGEIENIESVTELPMSGAGDVDITAAIAPLLERAMPGMVADIVLFRKGMDGGQVESRVRVILDGTPIVEVDTNP